MSEHSERNATPPADFFPTMSQRIGARKSHVVNAKGEEEIS